MSLLTPPPRLPDPPRDYNQLYMDTLLRVLRLHFNSIRAVGPLTGATLNLNIDTMPTEANFADLRSGDVYVDTTAGNVLKVKP